MSDPLFDRFWWENTVLMHELVILQGLVTIDRTKIRRSVIEKGYITGRCFDPDQSDSTQQLVKDRFGTARIAPLSAGAGGPRFFPGSVFNAAQSLADQWLAEARSAMDPLEGKETEDFLLLIHAPCLAAYRHGQVPLLRMIWELKQAKHHLRRQIPGLHPHAIDLAVQFDSRDSRQSDLLLVNEQVMREIIEAEVQDGALELDLSLAV